MNTQQFEVIRPKCAGLDVHKKSVVAAVCTSDPVTLTASYKTKVLTPPIQISLPCATGFSHRTATMSVWNPPVSTGFPFLISLNRICMSSSHTPSM